MIAKTSPKVIFRQESILALNSIDRNKNRISKDLKITNNLLTYFSDEKKKALNLVNYFTGEIGKEEKINLILENGNYATKDELNKRSKQLVNYIENANLYRCVVSFKKGYLEENISYEKLEQEFIKNVVPSFLRRLGFKDIKKMNYQASLHLNTDNPHFHLAFIEKEPNYKYKQKIGYRRLLLFDNKDINYLKNMMIHTIEKEKYYTPLLIQTNKEIDELKTYFKPTEKNFILKDKTNIILETKITELGKLLVEKEYNRNNKIKYNSIKYKEIKKLTNEIKKEIFKKEELKQKKEELNLTLNNIERYFSEIARSNNINTKELKSNIVKTKIKYIDNYILNSIINHANYKINNNKIIETIVLREYKKNKITKYDIVKNYLTNKNNKFINKNQIEKAIKNINDELEEAKEEFKKLFINEYEK